MATHDQSEADDNHEKTDVILSQQSGAMIQKLKMVFQNTSQGNDPLEQHFKRAATLKKKPKKLALS